MVVDADDPAGTLFTDAMREQKEFLIHRSIQNQIITVQQLPGMFPVAHTVLQEIPLQKRELISEPGIVNQLDIVPETSFQFSVKYPVIDAATRQLRDFSC